MENDPVTKVVLKQELDALERRIVARLTEVVRASRNSPRPLETLPNDFAELSPPLLAIRDWLAELERGRQMGGK